MSTLGVFTGTALGLVLGRYALRCWFNHLTLYSGVWGIVAVLYSLHLIRYADLMTETWALIVLAWVSLYLGSAFVLFAHTPRPDKRLRPGRASELRRIIIACVAVGCIGIISQIREISQEFGNLWAAVLVHGNELYNQRIDGSLETISYVGSFLYAACCLGGLYLRYVGRIALVGIIPFALIIGSSILDMQRGLIGITGFLFVASFVQTRKYSSLTVRRWRMVTALLAVVALGSVGMMFVNSARGLGVMYPNTTPAMEKIADTFYDAPSLYFYATGPIAGFNAYLRTEDSESFFGRYTFAPVNRVLARFGFRTAVPQVEEFYSTPAPINVCTYLKNVYSDFGVLGIFVFPFVLGAVVTFLHLQHNATDMPIYTVLLSHLQLVVVFSPFFNIMLTGNWLLSLLLCMVASLWLGRRRWGINPAIVCNAG